jgi:hypothetical protein
MPDYPDLTSRIAQLRRLIDDSGNQTLYFFDEFLREHEFDLALHVVCDFIIESPSVCISGSVLNEIRDLHKQMEIEDQCILDLENKIENEGAG